MDYYDEEIKMVESWQQQWMNAGVTAMTTTMTRTTGPYLLPFSTSFWNTPCPNSSVTAQPGLQKRLLDGIVKVISTATCVKMMLVIWVHIKMTWMSLLRASCHITPMPHPRACAPEDPTAPSPTASTTNTTATTTTTSFHRRHRHRTRPKS
jgi:hypothetical protein